MMLKLLMRSFSQDCASFACIAALVFGCAFVGVLRAEGERQVIARVGEEEVFADEVERELRAAYGEDAEIGQVTSEVWRRAAGQVVNRRLVSNYLRGAKQAASGQDVDFAIEQLRNELKAQGITLQEFFKRGRWQETDFRRHLAWTLTWQRFLDGRLTEANLQKFFERHPQDFDGREVRVAHLLVKADPQDGKSQAAALKEAERIGQEINGGKLSFDEAVKMHSQAPTAAAGGDIGFIRRREPMPEPFSKAALWLEEGEVSSPVVTPFGVHLIQCLEIRPGKRTWKDSEADLRKAVALYLFEWAAGKQRAKMEVEWMELKAVGVASGMR